jgi:hypothetical protein
VAAGHAGVASAFAACRTIEDLSRNFALQWLPMWLGWPFVLKPIVVALEI